jgi:S-methylmethionine-dependent homocysteine/selenocysteine methylase
METSLIFDRGLELPCFATFPLLEHDAGRTALRAYFEPFLAIAARYGVPFVLGTVTWRANPAWARPAPASGVRESGGTHSTRCSDIAQLRTATRCLTTPAD